MRKLKFFSYFNLERVQFPNEILDYRSVSVFLGKLKCMVSGLQNNKIENTFSLMITRKIDMTDNNYISWQRNREHWLSYNLKITYRKYIRLAKDSCMTLNDFHKTPSWLVLTYTLLPHPFKGLTHNLHKPSTWHLTGLQMTCIHNWQMAYKWLAMTHL